MAQRTREAPLSNDEWDTQYSSLPSGENESSSAPDPLLGQKIEKWELKSFLGAGGMSSVYRAKHQWLALEAAIKLLVPSSLEDSLAAKERFHQEAHILSQFRHPNIIEIMDFGIDPEHGAFMVLELLHGCELAKFVKQAPLPLSWVLGIFAQLCDALFALHEQGFVHRDLKPSNVFLVPSIHQITAKLLDFGVVKVPKNQEDHKLTNTGNIVGTPKYLSPEQVRSPGQVTFAADLYALGVMLYEVVVGAPPYEHKDVMEYLLMITQTQAPAIGLARPELAKTPLEALIRQLLSKDPRQRPSSAKELARQFRLLQTRLDDPYDTPERHQQLNEQLKPSLQYASSEFLSAARQSPFHRSQESSSSPSTPKRRSSPHAAYAKTLAPSGSSADAIPFAPKSSNSSQTPTKPSPAFRTSPPSPSSPQPSSSQPANTASQPSLQTGIPSDTASASTESFSNSSWESSAWGSRPSRPWVRWGRWVLGVVLMGLLGAMLQILWKKPVVPPSVPRKVVVQRPSPQTTLAVLEEWVKAGQMAFQRGDYEKATASWLRVFQHPQWSETPYYPKLIRAVGVACLQRKQHQEALRYFLQYKDSVESLQKQFMLLEKEASNSTTGRIHAQKRQFIQARLPSPAQFQQELQEIRTLQKVIALQTKHSGTRLTALYSGFTQFKAAMQRGQWNHARESLQKLLRDHSSHAKAISSEHRELLQQVRIWSDKLPRLTHQYKQSANALRKARFDKVFELQKELRKALAPYPLPTRWKRELQRQMQEAQRGQQLMEKASTAYRQSQWRQAYKWYTLSLKRFPESWNAKKIQWRIKACRCVFGPLPWESCQKDDLPKHYRSRP